MMPLDVPEVLNSYGCDWRGRRREEGGQRVFSGVVVFDPVGMEDIQRKDDIRISHWGRVRVKPSSSSDPPWMVQGTLFLAVCGVDS